MKENSTKISFKIKQIDENTFCTFKNILKVENLSLKKTIFLKIIFITIINLFLKWSIL
jgi:hypothetical protein